jgi:copper transport protein
VPIGDPARVKRCLVFVAIGFGFFALGASPAAAHATLESTSPAAGAELPSGEPPAEIAITFSEAVRVPDDAVQLYDSSRDSIPLSDVGPGANDAVVRASVPAALADGTYVVTYQVVSTDSHPIAGAFTFVVGTPSEVNPIDLLNRVLSQQGGSNALGAAFAVDRALGFLGALLAVGVVFFVRVVWPAAGARTSLVRLVRISLVTVAATSLLGIMFEAAYSTAQSFGATVDVDLIADVLDTRFGRASLARAVVALVAIPMTRTLGARPSPAVRAAEVGLGAALLATVTLAGHAATGPHVPLAATADYLHLVGGSVWLGGIAVLLLALRSTLPPGALDAARRFSTTAGPVVGLVVVTGAVQTWRQVEHVEGLWETTYGRLLVGKVLLVLCIVAAASASRDVVRRRATMTADERVPLSVGPGAAAVDPDTTARGRLRRSIAVEAGFALAVVAVTAVLVNTTPARDAYAAQVYRENLQAETLTFATEVTPNRAGTNELHLYVYEPSGALADVLDATAQLSNPGDGIPAIDVPLQRVLPGHYVATFQIPFPGTWRLEIDALRTEVDEESVTAELDVR